MTAPIPKILGFLVQNSRILSRGQLPKSMHFFERNTWTDISPVVYDLVLPYAIVIVTPIDLIDYTLVPAFSQATKRRPTHLCCRASASVRQRSSFNIVGPVVMGLRKKMFFLSFNIFFGVFLPPPFKGIWIDYPELFIILLKWKKT